MQQSSLTNGQIAFIALANEYCHTIEDAPAAERADLIATLLRQLPRIYIAATDLPADADDDFTADAALDEVTYDTIRARLADILGEDDVYLDASHDDDMKYSDTPLAASISEHLTDIFQVLYDFIETVRDAPTPLIISALAAIRADFGPYWSGRLCSALRALNAIRYRD